MSIIENSAIDSWYINFFLNLNKKIKKIIFYKFYIYNIKYSMTYLININYNNISFDNLFPCLNWLEREINEMYNINYINKNDIRKLLLDYSLTEYPLLKDFSEGNNDIYFNLLDNQVKYLISNSEEL